MIGLSSRLRTGRRAGGVRPASLALAAVCLVACGELETSESFSVVHAEEQNEVHASRGQRIDVDARGEVLLEVRRAQTPARFRVRTQSVDGAPVPETPAQSPGFGANDGAGDAAEHLRDTWLDRGAAVERIVAVDEGIWQSWLFLERPTAVADEHDGALVVRVHIPDGDYAGTLGGAHFFVVDDQPFQYGRATWIDDAGRRFDVESGWDAAAREVVLVVAREVLDASAFPAVLDPLIGPELEIDDVVSGPVGFEEQVPAVARGGSAWLAVWTDARNGAADIYGSRIDDNGTLLDPLGIAISKAANDQLEPRVAAVSGGWFVVWSDFRTDGFTGDVFGAFVAANGTVTQVNNAPQNFAIAQTAADERSPDVVANGAISPVVVWASAGDIRGATVTTAGVVTPFAAAIEASAPVQAHPSLALNPGAGGHVLVAWDELLPDNYLTVRARRITTAGVRVDTGASIVVSNGLGYRSNPRAVWAGSQFIVAYEMQYQDYDIRASRISTLGVDLDATDVALAPLVGRHHSPALSCVGSQCVMVFQRGDGFEFNVAAAPFNGTTLAASAPVSVSSHNRRERVPAVAASANTWLTVWQDERSGINSDIYAARLTLAGANQDASGVLVSRGRNRSFKPAFGSSPDGFLGVWMDSNVASGGRLRGRRFDKNGVPSQGVGLYIGGNINNGVALQNTVGLVFAGGSIDSSVTGCGTILSAGPNQATQVAGGLCGANTPFNPIGNATVPPPTNPPLNWTAKDALFYDWASPCNFYTRPTALNGVAPGFFYWDPTANNGACGAYAGALVPPSTDPTAIGGCWVPLFVGTTASVYAPYGAAAAQEVTTLSATSPNGCRSWEPQTSTAAITDPGGGTPGTAANWYTGAGTVARTKPDWSKCGGSTYPQSRVRWGTTPPNPTASGPDETCAGDCVGTTKVLDWCPALGTAALDFNFETVAARRAIPTGVYFVEGNYSHNDGNPYQCTPDDQTNPAPNGTVWPMMTLAVGGNYAQPNGQTKPCWGVGTRKGTYASLIVGGNVTIGSAQSFTKTAGSLLVRGSVDTKGALTFGTIRVDGGFGQQSSATFTWRFTRDISSEVNGGLAAIDTGAFTVGGGPPGGATMPAIARRATANNVFLTTWSDSRNDVWGDIYGARVNMTTGVVDAVGFPIAQTSAIQELVPAVATNGTDWLVVWQDRGAGSFDIHAARVAANGTVGPSDIVVSAAAGNQLVPAVAWEPGAGVYFVTWMDSRSGDFDIYGARVSSAGAVLDPAGVRITSQAGLQEHPDVAAGGIDADANNVAEAPIVAVVWADNRGVTRDIYAARVRLSSAAGTAPTVLDANGIAISTAAGRQVTPAIDSNGINFGIVWTDYRTPTTIDVFGKALLGTGVPLSPLGFEQGLPLSASSTLDESDVVLAATPATSGPMRGVLLYTRREPTLESERVRSRRVEFQ